MPGIATEHPTAISEAPIPLNGAPIPMRPLSERLVSTIDDAVWGMSKLITADPRRLEDPEIAERAKSEMVRYNAKLASNGRTSGQFEIGVSITEMLASLPRSGWAPRHCAPRDSPNYPRLRNTLTRSSSTGRLLLRAAYSDAHSASHPE